MVEHKNLKLVELRKMCEDNDKTSNIRLRKAEYNECIESGYTKDLRQRKVGQKKSMRKEKMILKILEKITDMKYKSMKVTGTGGRGCGGSTKNSDIYSSYMIYLNKTISYKIGINDTPYKTYPDLEKLESMTDKELKELYDLMF